VDGLETLGQKLLAEGLSAVFSQRVFPERRLEDHLLLSRRRLTWCQNNEVQLETMISGEMSSPRLIAVMFGRGDPQVGIPPRTGIYLGYRIVERALEGRGEGGFEELLSVLDITSVFSADEQGDSLES
jgi:uncharacterized protein YjaZ